MGHRADYKLTFLTPEGEPHYGIKEKQLIGEMNDHISCLGFTHNRGFYRLYESKWVDRDEDMRSFSVKHPDILFKFEVDFPDIEKWFHMYVLNGKIQMCYAVVTYPQYDPENLV